MAYTYRIDADNIITDLSEEWLTFARENEAPELTRERVLGRRLWDFVADVETRHLYELVFRKVRDQWAIVTIPFRCDSPTVRRFMLLTISPLVRANLRLQGVLVHTESRPANPLLGRTTPRAEDELLLICSWCRRVEVHEEWIEADEAVRRLDLFQSSTLPRLTHGICEDCMQTALQELGDDDPD